MKALAKSIVGRVRALEPRIAGMRRQFWTMTASSPDVNDLVRNLNFLDPWIIKNPYPYYEILRRRGSVHFLEQQKAWFVLDYDDVVSIMKQPQVFSNCPRSTLDPVLLGADPPQHTQTRQFMSPHFSPRDLSKLNDYIEESANKLVDEALKKPYFDIVSDFAIPLTEFAIARLLGLNGEDVVLARRAAAAGKKYEADYFESINRFFADYLNTVKGDEEGDMCARLVSASQSNAYSKRDIVGLLSLLWAAATASTRMLMSTSTNILLDNPELFSNIKDNQDLLPQYIEESLRFDSPTQTIWRRSVQETTVAGVAIPANAEIKLCLGAANRDPKHYDNPDKFLLERNPKDHLAFGYGPHYCMGAGLTRMETLTALKVLINRCPDLRRAKPGQSVKYDALEDSRALKSLLVMA